MPEAGPPGPWKSIVVLEAGSGAAGATWEREKLNSSEAEAGRRARRHREG